MGPPINPVRFNVIAELEGRVLSDCVEVMLTLNEARKPSLHNFEERVERGKRGVLRFHVRLSRGAWAIVRLLKRRHFPRSAERTVWMSVSPRQSGWPPSQTTIARIQPVDELLEEPSPLSVHTRCR